MKLKNIYTYGGQPAQRFLTVADFIQLRGTRKFTSTVPNTIEEAQACAEAGIDHLSIWDNVWDDHSGCPPWDGEFYIATLLTLIPSFDIKLSEL